MFQREKNPDNVKNADIVVGLASYNEADSIAYPTEQASLGLTKYFGDRKSVIINCDNHSMDGTEAAFMNTGTSVPKIYITTPPDTPGKGYNFENMFRKTLELGARTLVCVDADLLSITPEWIKHFVDAVDGGYDFANPVYARHKYDGTITKNICFPITYGLFCRNIRQPIGGDFSMSANFARHLISQPWHLTTQEYGVDIFMTMNAVTGGFKTCEVGLGTKVHKPSAPKLGPMFIQVVSTAFLTVVRNFHKWRNLNNVETPALLGLRKLEPAQDLNVDRSAIEKQACDSFSNSQSQLEAILSGQLYNELTRMFAEKKIDISAEQWMTVVYDMITAFKSDPDNMELVEALKGLYFARTLSFMNKTWDMTTEQAEVEVMAQAKMFHDGRDYLIKKLESL